jgi:endonuclease-3
MSPARPAPRPSSSPDALSGPLGRSAIDTVFATLATTIVPKTELVHASAFELLVAVVLSAHATDRSVNAATARLFAQASTPQAMAALGVEALQPYLKSINHGYTKARYVVALSRQLVERHGGEVPARREELEDLPGVGRKTASVILNCIFREPIIAVDTHIHRVANRLGIARTTTPLETERVLMRRVPPRWRLDAHHFLILHGRYTCMARKPQCWRCPVRRQCRFEPKAEPG